MTFCPHQSHLFVVHKIQWSDRRHVQMELCGCIPVVIIMNLVLWQPCSGISCQQRIEKCCDWPIMALVPLQASGIVLLL